MSKSDTLPPMEAVQKVFKKGYKFQFYPTEDQKVLLAKTFGSCRYVYNRALAEAKAKYEQYLLLKGTDTIHPVLAPRNTGYDFVNKLPGYKSDPNSEWLSEVNAVALQQAMLHLGSAYSDFFKKRKGYPKFKSKYDNQSFSLMAGGNSFRFKENALFIAKSKEPIAIVYSRELPSIPKSAIISKSKTGKYYVSFICEYTPDKKTGTGQIGIDLGLKDFLVASDGSRVANPRHLKRYEKLLKRRQQLHSRSKKGSKKGSKNREKARIKIALVHERISNIRKDFLHKLSTKLINENQVIGLETLKVKNMVKNHKLAKSISDASLSEFVTMLRYKAAASQNTTLVFMDQWYASTHLCSHCHTKLDTKLKLSQREWTCPACGSIHDRDLNAATNIKNEAVDAMDFYAVPLGTGGYIKVKTAGKYPLV